MFAINTISMVKNDALFSYIAPSNIFAWLLMPLRYCMPLRHFVWLNRTIIKVTHFPVLFIIYLYERFWLAPSMFEPTDLVENHGRSRGRTISFADAIQRTAMFSPNVRVREESVSGFHKDRALEEVFRRTPGAPTLRTQRRNERRKTQTAIRNWMDQHDEEGVPDTNWPTLDSRAVPEWQRRLSMSIGWDRPSHLRQVSDVRSIASDPAEFMSNQGASLRNSKSRGSRLDAIIPEYKDHTDADGDDELVTNDEEEEEDAITNAGRSHQFEKHGAAEEDYFTRPLAAHSAKLASSHESSAKGAPTPRLTQRRGMHGRTLSTNTILYNPEDAPPRPQLPPSSSASPPKATQTRRPATSGRNGGVESPGQPGRRSPPRRTPQVQISKPRPILAPRGMTETGGVSQTALRSLAPRDRLRQARRLSSLDLSILSDHLGMDDPSAALAGSFQTQMAMALMKDNRMRSAGGVEAADRDRMGRLVLARMKTLEESFADVIKEMRDLKNTSTAPQSGRNSSSEELRVTPGGSLDYDRAKKSRGEATPRKAGGKRPPSRRSMKESKSMQTGKREVQGKGKAIAYSTDGDEQGGERVPSFTKRGSSM